MPFTRANAESVLVSGYKGIMLAVGLSTVTDGTNADLNDPIRRGLAYQGIYAANPALVVDSDLAVLTDWLIEQFVDAASLKLLENLWGNWPYYSQKISQGQQEAQQLAERIQTRIKDLEERLRHPYGPGTSQVAVGQISTGKRIPGDNRPGRRYRYGQWGSFG